jgi:hypothetical protein
MEVTVRSDRNHALAWIRGTAVGFLECNVQVLEVYHGRCTPRAHSAVRVPTCRSPEAHPSMRLQNLEAWRVPAAARVCHIPQRGTLQACEAEFIQFEK